MKRSISYVSTIALFGWCFFVPISCGQVPTIKATIEVVDQDGKPVKDATVEMGFWGGPNGSEYGSKATSKKQQTPASGVVEIEGENTMGESGIIVSKSGYYEAWAKYRAPQLKNGRWEPWNQRVRMQLKEIRNPIPMYVFRDATSSPVVAFWFPSNQPDGPVGFDFFRQDLVTPHGKGQVADVTLTRESGPEKESGSYLVMRFTNPLDGIAGPFESELHSKFKSDYEAPQQGYLREFRFENGSLRIFQNEQAKTSFTEKSTIDRTNCWFALRLRSKVDDNGRLISCHYGKIVDYPNAGVLLVKPFTSSMSNLCYYINPTPNSRNLEWDTKTNLFEGVDRLNVPEDP
jgi:hypothetical protein